MSKYPTYLSKTHHNRCPVYLGYVGRDIPIPKLTDWIPRYHKTSDDWWYYISTPLGTCARTNEELIEMYDWLDKEFG